MVALVRHCCCTLLGTWLSTAWAPVNTRTALWLVEQLQLRLTRHCDCTCCALHFHFVNHYNCIVSGLCEHSHTLLYTININESTFVVMDRRWTWMNYPCLVEFQKTKTRLPSSSQQLLTLVVKWLCAIHMSKLFLLEMVKWLVYPSMLHQPLWNLHPNLSSATSIYGSMF